MANDKLSHKLSEREEQLISLATAGHTDAGIAHELGISEATVATYWGRIRIKLGPCSRAELVAIRLREINGEEIDALREQCCAQLDSLKLHGASGCTLEYHELFEHAPDALLVVTEEGFIEYVNLAGHSLFGYKAGELAGKNLSCLIPDQLVGAHRSHLREYVRSPVRREEVVHMEVPAKRRDGREILISTDLSSIETSSGLIFTAIIREVEDKLHIDDSSNGAHQTADPRALV